MEKIKEPEVVFLGEIAIQTTTLSTNIDTVVQRLANLLKVKDVTNMKSSFERIKQSDTAYLSDIHQFTEQGVILINELGYKRIRKGEVKFIEFYRALETFIENYENKIKNSNHPLNSHL